MISPTFTLGIFSKGSKCKSFFFKSVHINAYIIKNDIFLLEKLDIIITFADDFE